MNHRTDIHRPCWFSFIGIFLLLAAGPLSAALYPASKDAYSNGKDPNANYGNLQRINVTAWGPHTGFTAFDLRDLNANRVIDKAVLRLRVNEVLTAGSMGIHMVRDAWNETSLSANQQPRVDAQPIATLVLRNSDVGRQVEVDISAAVQSWQQGRTNHGLALRALGGTNVKLDSRETGSGSPMELEVTLQSASSRPNVVIVLLDDLDNHSLKRMVTSGLMPKLESRVIAKSTTFGNAFVTTSWCCPSRATLLTGLYSHNHNVLTNSRPLGGVQRFDDSSSLATWLQDGGYRTGLVGKYFNNYGSDKDATTPVDDVGYVPPGWDDWQGVMDAAKVGSRAFQMYNYTINDNGTLVRYGNAEADYQTDVFARRARQFIDDAERNNDQQPFFLLVAPTAPHLEMPGPVMTGCSGSAWSESIRPAPRHAGTLPADIQLPRLPNFNEADMRDKPSWFRQVPALTGKDIDCLKRQYRDRLNSLRAVDDLVGSVVWTLLRNDELQNTVFIFTSDNGFFYGQHRLTDKVLGYEESIRIPLYIRAPGFPAQTTWNAALMNDMASTVAEFAGITPAFPVDGRSLLPLLRDPLEENWRKRFLVEYLGPVESTRVPPRVPFTAVRTTNLSQTTPANQFYMEWHDGLGSKEFYDLATDRYQLNSQHNNATWTGIRNTLAGWLNQFRNCGGGSCQALEDQ